MLIQYCKNIALFIALFLRSQRPPSTGWIVTLHIPMSRSGTVNAVLLPTAHHPHQPFSSSRSPVPSIIPKRQRREGTRVSQRAYKRWLRVSDTCPATELLVACLMCRRAYWTSMTMQPHHMPSDTLIVLGGKDAMLDGPGVRSWLEAFTSSRVLYDPDMTHGDFLAPGAWQTAILDSLEAVWAAADEALSEPLSPISMDSASTVPLAVITLDTSGGEVKDWGSVMDEDDLVSSGEDWDQVGEEAVAALAIARPPVAPTMSRRQPRTHDRVSSLSSMLVRSNLEKLAVNNANNAGLVRSPLIALP